MGEGLRHFRSATDEIQREILKGTDDISRDFKKSTDLRPKPASTYSKNKTDHKEEENREDQTKQQ